MLLEPRTIAFILDCVHPVIRHDTAVLQRVYASLQRDRADGYVNFNLLPVGGAQISTVPGTGEHAGIVAVASVTFLPDRIQIKDEWLPISLEDFCDKAEAVLRASLDALGVKVLPMTQCVVRSLVSLRGGKDSRQFLIESLCRLRPEALGILGRSLGIAGLRLVLGDPSNPASVYNIRIESFNNDPRSLYLENVAVLAAPVTSDNLDSVTRAIRDAYAYVNDTIPRFIEAGMDGSA